VSQPLSLLQDVVRQAQTQGSEWVDDTCELTRRMAGGDEQAFRVFHERYFDRLYRFLMVIARGQDQEAREVLQETLVRVARYARKFEQEEVFWCWLKVVARSAARDGGRKRQRYLSLLERFALSFEFRQAIRPDDGFQDPLREALETALTELNSEERHLIQGKYLEGASTRELAVKTGKTEKSVESQLSRLRKQLRDRLFQHLNLP
jgi:RNA polymerase sigma-70 factor (ECF subfamily)